MSCGGGGEDLKFVRYIVHITQGGMEILIEE